MESDFVAAVRGGPQFRGWDEQRYIQVATLDAIRVLQYIITLVNSDPKKTKPAPPTPYPLPDKVKRAKTEDDKNSFAFIAKQKLKQIKRRKELKGGGVDGWR